jgi:hypothetical protein
MDPLPTQYPVRSTVSSEIFEMFLSALEGESIEVTKVNFKELFGTVQQVEKQHLTN